MPDQSSDALAGWRRWQAAWRRRRAGVTMRSRLIARLLALFTLASAGVGAATTVALSHYLLQQLDAQVIGASSMLSESIEHLPGQPPGPHSFPVNICASANHFPALAAGQSVGTFAGRLKHGRVTYACVVRGEPSGVAGLYAVRLSRADVALLVRLPRDVGRSERVTPGHLSGLGNYRLTAFVGQDRDVHIAGLPLSPVEATLHRLELIEIIVFGTALIVMGLAGTGLISLSLRPLDRIAATAAQVSDLPLGSGEVELPHRVPEADPRTEVGRLGRALNVMLGHVEASLAERHASEARLRQFIADASHELRTPLAGIRGYAELALRTSADLGEQARGALARIDAESGRMSHLVDDLLLLARLDAGRPLAHEPVDLTRLAIDVTNDARVAGPDHKWVLDLPEEPVVITGDQHRLHQVLANLLTNARNHTPKGTTVTVRVDPVSPAGRPPDQSDPGGDVGLSGDVGLTVTDNGPGIPAELQNRIWERFAKGDGSRSRTAGSTGLGLAIVKAVVTAHRGRLSLVSQPGNTTFQIWLPVDADPMKRTESAHRMV